uniref:Cytochrome p450 n=1 Tax=Schizaphis graminum TaxID=13262 RepID=A0A2S2NQB6_SCHGA
MISYLIGFLFDTPVITALAVLAAFIYYYTTNTYDKWLKLNVPHDRPWPLVGNTIKMLTLVEHQLTTIDGIYKRFASEKYCGFYQMKTPFLMIRDPELINNILIKDFSYFPDRGFHKDPALNMMANSLFFMEGSKWKVMRQKLSPGFTSGKLKLTHDQIAECSDELMRFIKAKMEENDQIEVKETMGKYSTDVIGTCAFGLKLDTVKKDDSDFRFYARKILKMNFRFLLTETVSPKILKLLGITEFSPEASAFFDSAFNEVIRYREENGIVRHDVAQSLIQARKELVLDSTDESKVDRYTNRRFDCFSILNKNHDKTSI